MDTRLFRIETRPGRLRQQDLPVLAQAIVGYHLGQTKVKTGCIRGVRYVRLETPSYHIQVMAEDWVKLLPILAKDSLNPLVVKFQADRVWYNPIAAQQRPTQDLANPQYYASVLSALIHLFPEAYPKPPKSLGLVSFVGDMLTLSDQVTPALSIGVQTSDAITASDDVSAST